MNGDAKLTEVFMDWLMEATIGVAIGLAATAVLWWVMNG